MAKKRAANPHVEQRQQQQSPYPQHVGKVDLAYRQVAIYANIAVMLCDVLRHVIGLIFISLDRRMGQDAEFAGHMLDLHFQQIDGVRSELFTRLVNQDEPA